MIGLLYKKLRGDIMNWFMPYWGAGFGAFLIVVMIWETIWKGIGMWKAAKNDHLAWFVAILIVNTAGILPIIYTIFFSKKKVTNVVVTPRISRTKSKSKRKSKRRR